MPMFEPNNLNSPFDYNLEADKEARRRKISALLQQQIAAPSRAHNRGEALATAIGKIAAGLLARNENQKADQQRADLNAAADARFNARMGQLRDMAQYDQNRMAQQNEQGDLTQRAAAGEDVIPTVVPSAQPTSAAPGTRQGIYSQMLREGPMAANAAVTAMTPHKYTPVNMGGHIVLIDEYGNQGQSLKKTVDPDKLAELAATDKRTLEQRAFESSEKEKDRKNARDIAAQRGDGSYTETKTDADGNLINIDRRTNKATPVLDAGGNPVQGPPSGGYGSSMNHRYASRVLGAANEGGAALDSVAKMGSSGGIFSGGHVGAGEASHGITGGIRNMLGGAAANTVSGLITTEVQKRYNASIAGLGPEIATAQNQGMPPNAEQIKHVEDALRIEPTDSQQTAQYKVALGARWLRKALEVSRTTANKEQQALMDKKIEELSKYPDPDFIANSKPGDSLFPEVTNGPGAALPPTNAKGWVLHTDKNNNQAYVSPDGKQFEEVH